MDTEGSPESPPGFWFTGNQNCVTAGRAFSGSVFRWRVVVPLSGYWHVEVHIPTWTQYGNGDIYWTTSDEGSFEDRFSQEQFHGKWRGLGGGSHRYTVGHEDIVELTQADAENGFCRYQTADQVKWVFDGPTAPSVTISSPPSGGIYVEGAVVPTSFGCAPGFNESLASCTDSNGVSGGAGTLNTSTPGLGTYTVTAKDVNGETGTASISYTVRAPKVSCKSLTGKAHYQPGLLSTAAVQTVSIAGRLTGCTGSGFTSAAFKASEQSANPVTCSALSSSLGEPASGTLSVKWKPKGGETPSTGTLDLPVGHAGLLMSGSIASGPLTPALLSGAVSQTFKNEASCGWPRKER